MFRKFTLITTFLAIITIVFGAYGRISAAGLGCPDWPGCFGKLLVDEQLMTMQRAVDARTVVGPAKAWTEMTHRYLAGALGVCVLILSLSVWRLKEKRLRAGALALASLTLFILQALTGTWAVAHEVQPLAATGHLILGYTTLVLLYWLYLETMPGGMQLMAGNPGLRLMARTSMLVLLLQIALGGWTTANYAGLACPDFPTCLGNWWPDVDYRAGLDLRQSLGPDYHGGVLPLGARAAIHWTHRLGALLAFVLLSGLAISLSSNRHAARLSKAGVLMSFLLLTEVSLGVAAVLFRLPVAVAVAHNALAALLLLNVVHVNVYLRRPRLLPAGAVPAIGQAITEPVAPPVPLPAPPPGEQLPRPIAGMFDRLRTQLGKTRSGLTGVLANLALGYKTIDRELLDDIEERLLMSDLGVNATTEIIQDLTDSLDRHELGDWGALNAKLRQHLHGILKPCSSPLEIPDEVRPFVILVVGVNGGGKTTTIGKLAKRLQNQGHSVMLAAGDTFRAAAVEQLQKWGERNHIQVVAQHPGADSASVIYDAVQSAQARSVDVLIADTAGRLHTKSNLMEELRKIKRIIGKLDESAPHEILLVVDAGTGQNAIAQARQFDEAVGLTGIALTKLDGTAKGGVIFALAKQFGIPIRFIGIGEGIDDLQDFDADKFIEALFETRSH